MLKYSNCPRTYRLPCGGNRILVFFDELSFGFWKIFLVLASPARQQEKIFFAFLCTRTYVLSRKSQIVPRTFALVVVHCLLHIILFCQKYQPNQSFSSFTSRNYKTDNMGRVSMESLDPNALSAEDQEMLDAFNKGDTNGKGMSVF